MMRKKHWYSLLAPVVFLVLLGLAWRDWEAAQSRAPVYGYRIVNSYPHDPQAFTQGLVFRDGFLFEGTGLYGRSSLRKVRLETGEVIQQEQVDPRYFAEGLADWKGQLIQLTYQSHVGLVYDVGSFKLQTTFRYSGEGWGLTQDGTGFIMSDGSDTLRFLNPTTFRERGRISVKDGSVSVKGLNELEYVRGEVYANVWPTNRIARIEPKSGRVVGWIDLTGLLSQDYRHDPDGILNGIAFDSEHDRLFVTGKLWPRLFEIKLERR